MPFADYKFGIRIGIRKLAAWPRGQHTRLMKKNPLFALGSHL